MYTSLYLQKAKEKPILQGSPWIYKSDIVESSSLLFLEPGSLVDIYSSKMEFLGVGYYNGSSQIAVRLLSFKSEVIDVAFFQKKLQSAEKRRQRLTKPFYRLVHSEADHLPGLVIDRFGECFVCQISTAGMERLWPEIRQALEMLYHPKILLLRNDVPARLKEGLPLYKRCEIGEYHPPTPVQENHCIYLADLWSGQKTGWFFDQRDNRALVASYCQDKSVLDVFCHSGGFAIAAAVAGAKKVIGVDRSQLALEMAKRAAEMNHISDICDWLEEDAITALEQFLAEKHTFEVVILDPPAYVKSKKDIAAGMSGYRKLAEKGSLLCSYGGILYIASCSHHATFPLFKKAVEAGLTRSKKQYTLLHQTQESIDHPKHPVLSQNSYLKSLIYRID